jgi:hypothetical protein
MSIAPAFKPGIRIQSKNSEGLQPLPQSGTFEKKEQAAPDGAGSVLIIQSIDRP